MAEVTNELIDEVLKAMQARLVNIEHKVGETDNRLGSISGQLRGLPAEMGSPHTGIANICQTLGHVDGRLARMERRLDIIDQPAE